ncbi:MAG TPA: rod-binding protein [Terriglobales bacterium]|nr:rod-binding protein [Terriglobales bacterium]
MSTIAFLSNSSTLTKADLSEAKSAQAVRGLEAKSANDSFAKIDKAAKEFEGILLGEWLEKAEKSFASVPGADPDQDSDPGHDQFQSIGCQFLAEALSKAGGIGIASMISQHLEASEASRGQNSNQAASGNSINHGNLQKNK